MSFKTAIASCWDVFKRNCKVQPKHDHSSYVYPFFTLTTLSFPKFNFNLYEAYSVWTSEEIPFPYTEKPSKKEDLSQHSGYKYKYKAGLTEPEDKIASSFLGWIFVIPEMLVWLIAALDKTLWFIVLFLMAVTMIVGFPFFFLSKEMRKWKYQFMLEEIFLGLRYSISFTILALLRIPYHLLKVIIRIPVGMVIVVKAIVAPSLSPVQPIQEYEQLLAPLLQQREQIEQLIQEGNQRQQQLDQRQQQLVQEENQLLQQREQRIQQLRQPGQLAQQLDQQEQQLDQQEQQEQQQLIAPQFEDSDFALAQTASMNQVSAHSIQVPEKENPLDSLLDQLNIDNKPKRYTCAISYCLMNPSFLVGDGKFYDESFIKAHLVNSATRKSPLTSVVIPVTHLEGIILPTVNEEISAFVVALRAGYHFAKIKGEDPTIKQKVVFNTAGEIERMADDFYTRITAYIKKFHSPSVDREALAREMSEDAELKFSSSVIATAWKYIKELTGEDAADIDFKIFLFLDSKTAIDLFLTLLKR